MDLARTRGQPTAVETVSAMLRSTLPHALLLVGPAGSGKTTLALDVAAALLCTSADPSSRPCRACRGCRMVESGNHPDLHRLRPGGPGGQVVIGGRESESSGVRDLVTDLALLPVEGGARIGIVEQAHRMNEIAQSALLKTLEEPPAGVVIVLCADDEERLLPTIRSRAARIRLGPVPTREIEAFLADRDAADPPTAARLARLAGGRPGVALALALAPNAVSARGEIARTLLDATAASPAGRLVGIREILLRALDAIRSLEVPAGSPADGGQSRRASGSTRTAPTVQPGADPETDGKQPDSTPGSRLSPAERRRAAAFVLGVWGDVARDLALAGLGEFTAIRDPGLIDDLVDLTATVPDEGVRVFLGRLERAGELLEANVGPELILDSLILGWPRRASAAR